MVPFGVGDLAGKEDARDILRDRFKARPVLSTAHQHKLEFRPVTADGPGFPHASAAFGPLKAVAEKTGSSDFTNLWAGQAVALAGERPAEDLTRALAEEALRRLRALAV